MDDPSGDRPLPDALALALRNWFSNERFARHSERRLTGDLLERSLNAGNARFVPVVGGRPMAAAGGHGPVDLARADARAAVDGADSVVYLGHDDGVDLFALCFDDAGTLPRALAAVIDPLELRSAAPVMGREAATLAAYATAMGTWHRNHRFCGACGSPTRASAGGHVLMCTNERCGRDHYPRTDPAVIVLAEHEGHCLLGRKPEWPEGRYSTIAGFVEPGETAEQAVVREVFEETGVEVQAVHYHSSQPWPFPGSLMIGFHAQARERVVELRDGELTEARWMTRGAIAEELASGVLLLPTTISIAYRLIEDWFDRGPVAMADVLRSPRPL
jgi:NAD+ diphosphatase